MSTTHDEIPALVRHLARYLRTNPFACDTCEGIERWWLASDPPLALPQLQQALDWMVARALLERLPAADGRVRYRRAPLDQAGEDTLRRLAEGAAPGALH